MSRTTTPIQPRATANAPVQDLRGSALLNDPVQNKGTAFTADERRRNDLELSREENILEYATLGNTPHWSLTVIDKLSIRPKTTALLLMDFQRMVVDSYALDKEALLERVKRLAAAARNSGAMVIHVVVGFQLGYPEISERNSSVVLLK
jgi:hypothetical protein